jgi:hypothetical protein
MEVEVRIHKTTGTTGTMVVQHLHRYTYRDMHTTSNAGTSTGEKHKTPQRHAAMRRVVIIPCSAAVLRCPEGPYGSERPSRQWRSGAERPRRSNCCQATKKKKIRMKKKNNIF